MRTGEPSLSVHMFNSDEAQAVYMYEFVKAALTPAQ